MIEKMNKDDVIYYLGLAVVVCLFVYVVLKSLVFQRDVIEGAVGGRKTTTDSSKSDTSKKSSSEWSNWFSNKSNSSSSTSTSKSNTSNILGSSTTDKTKIPDAIKSNTHTIEDNLLISKYRTTYEQSIIELESNVSYALLSAVLNNAESISADPTSNSSQSKITQINNLKTFRSSLNDAMKFLDKS